MIGHKYDPASPFWRFIVAEAYERAFARTRTGIYDLLIAERHMRRTKFGYTFARSEQIFIHHLFHTFDLFSSPSSHVKGSR